MSTTALRHPPTDALVAVTFRCNSQCTMCSIWQIKEHDDLPVERYDELPTSIRHFNLSGGEPFMRPEFEEITERLARRNPEARYVISSNGFRTKTIVETVGRLLKKVPKLGMRISIDGPREKHDELRRIPNGFDKCMATLEGLRSIGVTDLGIGYTVMDQNLDGVLPVYELTRRLGIQFSITAAQNSDFFFQNEGQEFHQRRDEYSEVMQELVSRELKGWHPKRWFRAYFEARLRHFILDEERYGGCVAGRASLYLAPRGEIYPCNMLGREIGNLRDQSFAEIWNGERADEVRRVVDHCPNPCWMVCSSASWIRRRPQQPLGWIVENKLRAHLGMKSTTATPEELRKDGTGEPEAEEEG